MFVLFNDKREVVMITNMQIEGAIECEVNYPFLDEGGEIIDVFFRETASVLLNNLNIDKWKSVFLNYLETNFKKIFMQTDDIVLQRQKLKDTDFWTNEKEQEYLNLIASYQGQYNLYKKLKNKILNANKKNIIKISEEIFLEVNFLK